MRKYVALVAVLLLASVLVFAAMQKGKPVGPAKKATGEVGYTINFQRWMEFTAHEGTENCTWNLVGSWTYEAQLGSKFYVHDMSITSQADESLSGTGSYLGEPQTTWTMSGTVSGNIVNWRVTYPSNYWAKLTGTIAEDGTMSGTWTDSNGNNGTWHSTSGNAEKVCEGKGMLHYRDVNGGWYFVDIQYVKVEGDKAYFAGPVTMASQASWVGNWSSAAVRDGGEPAYMVDHVWGIFTDIDTAKYNVAYKVMPSEYPVTSGNLQVHTYEK